MDIRNVILSEIELLAGKHVLDDDEIIFGKEKLLDSLNVLHILLFIEINFKLAIDTKELTIENFNTINKIITYVESKL